MSFVSDFGLDIIREVVGVVVREVFVVGYGLFGVGRVYLFDVVFVVGVNDSRDVEVGEVYLVIKE